MGSDQGPQAHPHDPQPASVHPHLQHVRGPGRDAGRPMGGHGSPGAVGAGRPEHGHHWIRDRAGGGRQRLYARRRRTRSGHTPGDQDKVGQGHVGFRHRLRRIRVHHIVPGVPRLRGRGPGDHLRRDHPGVVRQAVHEGRQRLHTEGREHRRPTTSRPQMHAYGVPKDRYINDTSIIEA